MAFYNSIQRIVKDYNDNIILFYNIKGDLFYRKFLQDNGWGQPTKLLSSVKQSNINVKIDEDDNLYGIISDNFNTIHYLFEDNNSVVAKELFTHNETIGKDMLKASLIKYPTINKYDDNLLISYYSQDKDKHSWSLTSHYYSNADNEWIHLDKIKIKALPLVQPYQVFLYQENPLIVYFNNVKRKEEIFIKNILANDDTFNESIQITNSNNQKLYLDYYLDGSILLLTWSEFENENLIVKFMRYDLINNSIINKITNLSNPSNCSYPSLIMVQDTLWCTWSQMNKVYSSYSKDHGKSWSKPRVKSEAGDKYIRFKYATNISSNPKYILNQSFGITNPLKFIGFY